MNGSYIIGMESGVQRGLNFGRVRRKTDKFIYFGKEDKNMMQLLASNTVKTFDLSTPCVLTIMRVLKAPL